MHPHRPTIIELLVALALVAGIVLVLHGLLKNYERGPKAPTSYKVYDKSR